MPQPPQLALVLSGVSQPLLGLPSQSANPGAQVGTQTPALQAVAPCALAQVTPHAPQFDVVLSWVSQPLPGMPSQLPNPPLQPVSVQVPVEHDALALGSWQVNPQPPQLLLVLSGASQPLAGLLSQLPRPALQAPSVHCPPGHDSLALARSQTTPQPPQFAVVSSGVSHPLFGLPSQSPKPGLHDVSVQLPLVHDEVALPRLQGKPQPPQFWLVLSGVSQPFD